MLFGTLTSSQMFYVGHTEVGRLRKGMRVFAVVLGVVPVKAESGAQEILAAVPAAGGVFFITAETSQRRTRSDISHEEFPLCLQVK